MRPDTMGRIYQTFAGPARSLAEYKNWLANLATKAFADELVLVAVAMELKVRIVAVPFTPSDSMGAWAISTYHDADALVPEDRNIYLGNNDVHYIWLSPYILDPGPTSLWMFQ